MTNTEKPKAARATKEKSTVSKLLEKFWADFASLSGTERIRRIGEIFFAATIGKYIGERQLLKNDIEKKQKAVASKKKKEGIPQDAEDDTVEKKESVGKRLADIAKKFVGVINPDFRTSDVRGGVLGCAKVATTILKEAGLIDAILLGVDATARKLKKEGWKEVKKPPHPGDIIVWAPTGGYIKDPNGADVAKGHRHIGIAINETRAVSNSSRKKMPLEHNIFTKRPVEKILRAPAKMAA